MPLVIIARPQTPRSEASRNNIGILSGLLLIQINTNLAASLPQANTEG